MISGVAIALAAVHLIWPHLHIDAVTLALVVVALVPWLAPIFRSIELPGGWRFEYQEIQRQVREVQEVQQRTHDQVREVQHRVEGVERLLFTGDTTPELEAQLTASVRGFASYLRDIDPALSVSAPSVKVKEGLGNASYHADEIQLDPEFAADDYAVVREYAHHVLLTVQGSPLWNPETGYAGLESGLADYLVASYHDDPGLGPALATRLRERTGGAFSKPFVRNLDNDHAVGSISLDHSQVHARGEAWGGAFWSLRSLLGQAEADRLLTAAWIEADWIRENPVDAPFVAAIVAAVGDERRASVAAVFADRGIAV